MKYRDLRIGTLLGAAVAGPSMVSGAAGAQDFSALTTCCWHDAARPARTCERKNAIDVPAQGMRLLGMGVPRRLRRPAPVCEPV
jgi:hypothetical protein